MSLLRELANEFKTVLGGNNRIADVIIPPLIFLIANRLGGLSWGFWSSLIAASVFLYLRIMRGQPIGYAIGGLASAALATGLSFLTNSPSGYFLPGLISGGLTVAVSLISVLVKRPLAAWSSHLTRGWPTQWYWHNRVRPAYGEVTWGWTLFFGARFYIQAQTYLFGSAETLGIIQLLTGWPALIIVLALSYIYGTWRLRNLTGPSVKEFEAGADPPWEGQQKGF